MRRLKKQPVQLESGLYVVLLSIVVVALLALVGLALDGGRIFIAQQRLQHAVDAAAMGYMDFVSAFPPSLLQQDATATVQENLRLSALDQYLAQPVVVNINQSLGRISVTAALNLPLFFLPVLPGVPNDYPIQADATAGSSSIAVMLVLDVSGSMDSPVGNKKIDRLKEGVQQFINQLDDNDYIGITSFSDNSTLRQAMTQATAGQRTTINQNIVANLPANGGTCIACGLQRGRREILRVGNGVPSNARKYVVLFTDGVPEHSTGTTYNQFETFSSGTACGWPSGARRQFYQAIAESDIIRRYGIPVFTIGVGTIGADQGDICRIASPPSRNQWQVRGCFTTPSSEDLDRLRPFILMRLANTTDLDTAYVPPVPGPESSVTYSPLTGLLRGSFPPFLPNSVVPSALCETGNPGSPYDDTQSGCACIPRIGPAFPRGVFLAANNPTQISDRFQSIFRLVKLPRLSE